MLAFLAWPGASILAHDDDERSVRSELREERRERDEMRRQRDLAREQKDREQKDREGREGSQSNGRSGSNQSNDNSATRNSDSGSSNRGSGHGESSDNRDDKDDDDFDRNTPASVARIEIDVDIEGRERRRDEVLMIGRQEALDAIRAAGFSLAGERVLSAFSETLARVRVRAGASVEQTIVELQTIAPTATFAPHHLFRAAGEDEIDAPETSIAPAMSISPTEVSVHIGLVDTGADTAWSALEHAVVETQGFADGGYTPRFHGTRVAEVAASHGAKLSIGDVFGVDSDNRLIASAEAIAAAIHWLVATHVRIINVSIEGPDNLVLAHVIRRAIQANSIVVAAAGNGGPGAKPVFPAAYPGVIAVTAIDEQGRVYRRANHGDYISFAARGVRVASRYDSPDAQSVSGTSYAAPVVAAMLAKKLHESPSLTANDAIAALRRNARDLGAPGRDPIFGWGVVEATEQYN